MSVEARKGGGSHKVVRGEDGGGGIMNQAIWKQRGEKGLNK